MATKTCVNFFTAAIFTYRLLFFTLHCLQFCVQGASENKENDNYFASARWIPRFLRQYHIILSADTASEVRQMLSQ
ncbi:MAG: hypothetical protein Q4Q10_08815, partial [Eubacteriales bacterium]|nr:hypothetical protein [Eubacteriales bacterium]